MLEADSSIADRRALVRRAAHGRRSQWRRCRLVFVGLVGLLIAAAAASAQDAGSPRPGDALAIQIRRQLDAATAGPRALLEGEKLMSIADVRAFYERRGFGAAWLGSDEVRPKMSELVGVLRATVHEGLRPADYHAAFLDAALSNLPTDSERRATVDILLTDGFLSCARHFAQGRLDPVAAGISWSIERPHPAYPPMLEDALRSGTVVEALRALLPADPAYGRLRGALARYRGIAAGGAWRAVGPGPVLRAGSRDVRVVDVRRRLATEGGQPVDSAEPDLFDDLLARAVVEFQTSHGLDTDGVLGPRTLAELNRPVQARIDQIVANMERWRWLPVVLASRRIVVNIAEFRLGVVEENREVLSMKAIVGQPYKQTPIFDATMTYLVFGPYWNVPDSIARDEILARARRSPAFLARERIRIFRGWSDDEEPISPWRVAWHRLSRTRFPFRLRQDPGPDNPLGRVKFVLPNPFDVYLHDTPAPSLFDRSSRPFSHGCVRLARPLDLAAYLLRGDPAWGRDEIEGAMNRAVDEAVRLPDPIPVYFLYWTAWGNEDGSVEFRSDVYGRDATLTRVLDEAPPITSQR